MSFMMILVDMITSSAVCASSLMIRYTICRNEGSLFWKSLEILKNRVVASVVGNLSPVNSRTAIFVSKVRHFRGEIGEVLKRRAVRSSGLFSSKRGRGKGGEVLTVLEDRCSVQLEARHVGILVPLCVSHR